jgi:histidyl-tRNA synthetase
MAKPLFQALPGTRDLMAPDTDRMREFVAIFADEASKAGFGQVVPPMFEDVGVFTRLGATSDVVSKELYDFNDKADRHIALRPEHTASVCRIFAEKRPLTPWRTWYAGPNFRYDKPQKGRYRQFDQVGAELIGSDEPDSDTELIALAARFFERIGLRNVTLLVNSLGDRADRPAYLEALTGYLIANIDRLSEQSRITMATNPLRVLDSKRREDAQIIAAAPIMADYLGDGAAASFERVKAGLSSLGIKFQLAPRLVRGLDYYNRTAFEFISESLDGSQTAIGGGGRYDGLIEDLGGPAESGVGFALGVDRTLLACDAEGVFDPPDVTVDAVVVSTADGTQGLEIADELRRAGVTTARADGTRSMKGQMKMAGKSGAKVALIVGPDEAEAGTVSVRPMLGDAKSSDGPTQLVVPRADVVATVSSLLSS